MYQSRFYQYNNVSYQYLEYLQIINNINKSNKPKKFNHKTKETDLGMKLKEALNFKNDINRK
jgi:hypothetical protein